MPLIEPASSVTWRRTSINFCFAVSSVAAVDSSETSLSTAAASVPQLEAPFFAPLVPAVASAIDDGAGSWRLMLAEGKAPSDALATLVNAGAVIDRFEPMLAPMEDIFLRVVREGQVGA